MFIESVGTNDNIVKICKRKRSGIARLLSQMAFSEIETVHD